MPPAALTHLLELASGVCTDVARLDGGLATLQSLGLESRPVGVEPSAPDEREDADPELLYLQGKLRDLEMRQRTREAEAGDLLLQVCKHRVTTAAAYPPRTAHRVVPTA